MVKPKKFGHLYLVYHFIVPLNHHIKAQQWLFGTDTKSLERGWRKKLSDSSIYKEVKATAKDLVDLVDKNKNLCILGNEKHNSLSKIPGCPVISNCAMCTDKTADFFLDHHLQPLVKEDDFK